MQDLAQRLYDEGRFDEAAGVCRDILMRHPRDLDAMHLLGLVHVRRHEAANAVPLLHAVAAARPSPRLAPVTIATFPSRPRST